MAPGHLQLRIEYTTKHQHVLSKLSRDLPWLFSHRSMQAPPVYTLPPHDNLNSDFWTTSLFLDANTASMPDIGVM